MRCRIEQPSEQRNFPHCLRLDGWMSTAINNQSCCRCHWDAVGIRITIALKLRRLKRPEINGPESRRQLEGLVIRRRRISSGQQRAQVLGNGGWRLAPVPERWFEHLTGHTIAFS